MSYIKQTWTDGTSIANAERLNHIEDGIYKNSLDNTYSTNEIDTGKVWIDGKPIYRKVINLGQMPNSGAIDYPLSLSNVNIISWTGNMYNETEKLPFNFYTSTSSCLGHIKINDGQVYFKIYPTSNRNDYNGILIVEYTKTS